MDDLLDFYRRVLPGGTNYCLFTAQREQDTPGHWVTTTPRTHWCQSLAALVQETERWADTGREVWYGTAAFTDTQRRAAVVQSKRAFYLDVDVGPDKPYVTQAYALEALNAFQLVTGTPAPSLVVSSGLGLHIYWTLTQPLDVETWRSCAGRLKKLTQQREFKADPAVTADVVRVLRPPQTRHIKTGNVVTVLAQGEDYALEQLPWSRERKAVNDDARPAPSGSSETTLLRANSALLTLSPDTDYDTWFRHSAAFKSGFPDEAGFQAWYAWSTQGDYEDWPEEDARIKWDGIRAEGGTTLNTLFAAAFAAGWSDTSTKTAPKPETEWAEDEPETAGEEVPWPDDFFGLPKGYQRQGNRVFAVANGELGECVCSPLMYVRDVGYNYVTDIGDGEGGLLAGTLQLVIWLGAAWAPCYISSGVLATVKSFNQALADRSIFLRNPAGTRRYIMQLISSAPRSYVAENCGLQTRDDGLINVHGRYVCVPDGSIRRCTTNTETARAASVPALQPFTASAQGIYPPEVVDAMAGQLRAFTRDVLPRMYPKGTEAFQTAISLGLHSPLLQFIVGTPSAGAVVALTGASHAGKTTAIRVANTLSLSTEAAFIHQTTEKGLYMKLAELGTYALGRDELTNIVRMKTDALSRLVYSISSGSDMLRGGVDGHIRRKRSWASITLTSSNTQLRGALETDAIGAGAAEQMRLLELNVDELPGTVDANTFFDMEQNHLMPVQGTYGLLLGRSIVMRGPENMRTLARACLEHADRLITGTGGRRFQWLIGCILAGHHIMKQDYGITTFPVAPLCDAIVENIETLREDQADAQDEYASVSAALVRCLESAQQRVHACIPYGIAEYGGAYDVENPNILYVSTRFMRAWCSRVSCGYSAQILKRHAQRIGMYQGEKRIRLGGSETPGMPYGILTRCHGYDLARIKTDWSGLK